MPLHFFPATFPGRRCDQYWVENSQWGSQHSTLCVI